MPPFGHPAALPTLLDVDLLDFDEVWAAAGSSTAVFGISPARLVEITGTQVAKIN